MALSNRERIDRMFVAMAPALDDFIASIVGQGNPSLGAEWTKLVQGKDLKNGAPSTKTYEPLDPQVQFRMLTEANISGGYRKGWYPFDEALGMAG
ncbi:Swt1 family HEPN domain-containing protein, partial [Mycobacterium timonense]